MSKRLKRKIYDMCNLDSLSKEERYLTAKEIKDNVGIKQKMCNAMPGLTFKDIERAMAAILARKEPSEEEELMELAPEKFEQEEEVLIEKPREVRKGQYRTLTRDEVQALIKAGEKPIKAEVVSERNLNYPTYTQEQVSALIDGTYEPFALRRARKNAGR